MESSAVSLRWRLPSSTSSTDNSVLEDYKINLIDTPGHVDFSSEVSTASRLCDGAFVLVDSVEGVCTQTIQVLRTVYLSHLRPLLVINKLDRLITELKLSPSEAYHHLQRIIEDVNAVVGSFYSSERMEQDYKTRRDGELEVEQDARVVEEERDDASLYFDPVQGNVLFASAIDGWAFRISKFAQLYSSKLGMSEQVLNKVLWGEWYLDPKNKKVLNRKKMEQQKNKLKPLFVQFVLENIWSIYDAIVLNPNPLQIEKIIKSLNVKVRPQDLRSKDSRNLLLTVFSQWLPLAPCSFTAIVDKIPEPSLAQKFRIPRMLHPELGHLSDEVEPLNKLERDLYSGNLEDDSFVISYVSKMFAVKKRDLPENQRKALTADDLRERARLIKRAREERAKQTGSGDDDVINHSDGVAVKEEDVKVERQEPDRDEDQDQDQDEDALIGFARLYSGTISIGQTLYAVLPKYNTDLPPSHQSNLKHLTSIKVEQLYMMMGRELLTVDRVEAGNLFAIGGLQGTVLRNATLCSMGATRQTHKDGARDQDGECLVNLAGVSNQTSSLPIVRVALEPRDPSEMSKLVEGLRLLNQADPCVETLVQSTGEHVILTAGELHLERCLKDLKDRFAKIEITVSPPIVPFRETAVVVQESSTSSNVPRGTIQGSVQSNLVEFTIRAVPLPSFITQFLIANQKTLKRLQQRSSTTDSEAVSSDQVQVVVEEGDEEAAVEVKPEEFWDKLESLLNRANGNGNGKDFVGLNCESIWSFAPKRVGPNILFDKTGSRSLKRRLERQAALPSALATPSPSHAERGGKGELDLSTLKTSLNEQEQDEEQDEAAAALPDVRELDENFDTAFQLSMQKGPLCSEPVIGMAYFFENVQLNTDDHQVLRSKWSNARGQLISQGQEAFKQGLLDWSPRLQLAMYTCDIQATGEVLGKVYGVVSKRKGRIISEEMKEGTAFFTVTALLPVVESFGFADG